MLSDTQRALLAARLRQNRRDVAADGRHGPMVALSDGGGQQPLFLIHAVSGTVYGYGHLARALAGRFRVYGVEAAGLRAGSTPGTSLDEMASRYAGAIRDTQPTGPYALGGWSMGGVIAFEVAHRLQEQGEEVMLLLLIDTPGRPRLPAGLEPGTAFVADVSRSLGWDWAPSASASGEDAFDELARRLAADNSPDDNGLADNGLADSGRADLERRYEVFKAHWGIIDGYRPAATVRADALVVGADRSPDSIPDWSRVIAGAVRALRLSGDHYTCLMPPCVQEIAAAVEPR